MNVWMNKKADLFIATPWWEIPQDILDETIENYRTRFGVLVQVGWLLENEHGVFFGMRLDTKELFEDLGPLKPENGKQGE